MSFAAETFFTIGQFADLHEINKKTLMWYDEIGLLKPAAVRENGYRYYSYTQLETFAIIRTLRDLGVHINEIKQHMDNRSPEALIRLLESKKTEIAQKIDDLTRAGIYIDRKIEETKEGLHAPLDEVVFENSPDEYLITTDYKGADDEKAITEAVGEHFAFCQKRNLCSAYPIGAIIPRSSVTDSGYKYSQFYTVVHPSEIDKVKADGLTLDRGGRCLAVYDKHGYENIFANCRKLIDYAAKNNLTLGDKFYEDVILDDLSTEGYYNYLVKLSVNIEG